MHVYLMHSSTEPGVAELNSFQGMVRAVGARLKHTLTILVPPHDYLHGKFARFSDFLPVTSNGRPLELERPNQATAHAHLQALLVHVIRHMAPDVPQVAQLSRILVGFSKGGTVLTRLVKELPLLLPAQRLPQISALHFLDVGLGAPGTHPTLAAEMQALAATGVPVLLHGTPRQWECAERGFIRYERDEFVRQLLQCGAVPFVHLYHAEEPSTLEQHFAVLREFFSQGVDTSDYLWHGLEVQLPWSTMILRGQKAVESRNYPLPSRFVWTPLKLVARMTKY